MIMTMEGLMSESLEDMTGTDAALEPTHTDEDEQYYVEWIMTGAYDEQAEQEDDRDFPGDYYSQRELDHFADLEADRWEINYWGDY